MGTDLAVGDIAPDFELPDQEGNPRSLRDLREHKAVVLYFYPKDGTPGCTIESCGFRDAYEMFTDADAEVVGVSGDGIRSHEKFVKQYGLPFTLLSDEHGQVRRAYGVKRTLGLIDGRVTFVIDTKGRIVDKFSSQLKVSRHVKHALDIVRSL